MTDSAPRLLLIFTALLGACAVGLGALGGHAMQSVLDASQLATWETATRYLMWHVLAALALLLTNRPALRLPVSVLLVGALLFSASLYLWLITGLRPLVFITPLGGVTLIAGWLLLAWTFVKS